MWMPLNCTMRSLDLSNPDASDKVSAELINAAQAGFLTVWVGAGISYSPPASLPLASQMVGSTCHAIASELSISSDVLLAHHGQVMRLEPFLRLVEAVGSFKDIERLLDVLRQGKPNQNHFALASLLSMFSGCAVISLNFDYLIEEALQDNYGKASKVIVPAGPHEECVFPLPTRADAGKAASSNVVDRIIKPHGTLMKDRGSRGIVATIQELGSGLPLSMQERLRNLIHDRILLVIGYSDDDIDLFPIIQTTHPRAVYWNTLSNEIPSKVNEWLLQLDKSISITHLTNKCEYLFNIFPTKAQTHFPDKSNLNLDDYTQQWVRDLNSVATTATIAAWLAQDRHRVDDAKRLYTRALEQEECKRDKPLCRFIRYRYAELLRHQAEEKRSALTQYLLILQLALHRPLDLPLIMVTIRSLASSARSMSHRNHYLLALTHSLMATIFLLTALILSKIISEQQWNSSRFHRDKGGTWLSWEFGMVTLGIAQRMWWPKPIRRFLLNKAVRMFEISEKSTDIYERSASIFGQARTIGMISTTENNVKRDKEKLLLKRARELFILLDDVKGLENADQLQKAFDSNGPDPWLSPL